MHKLNALAICVFLLNGCATVKAEGTMLSENTALISTTGNNAGDHGPMIDRALKEAANIANMHGYRYFVILSADNTTTTTIVSVPGQKWFVQRPNPRPIGATTFTVADYPGGSYTTPDEKVTRIKPGLDIIIQMYRQGEVDPNREGVWNTDVVLGRFTSAQ